MCGGGLCCGNVGWLGGVRVGGGGVGCCSEQTNLTRGRQTGGRSPDSEQAVRKGDDVRFQKKHNRGETIGGGKLSE